MKGDPEEGIGLRGLAEKRLRPGESENLRGAGTFYR